MINLVIANLATVLYTIYNFNYLSISIIIINSIAIPIVTLIIISLGIIYVLQIIASLIEFLIKNVLYIINAITSFHYLIFSFVLSLSNQYNIILIEDHSRTEQIEQAKALLKSNARLNMILLSNLVKDYITQV
ncbi:MAG: hypothetical protein ACR5KW_03405 [Wolbachia sp.]